MGKAPKHHHGKVWNIRTHGSTYVGVGTGARARVKAGLGEGAGTDHLHKGR